MPSVIAPIDIDRLTPVPKRGWTPRELAQLLRSGQNVLVPGSSLANLAQ